MGLTTTRTKEQLQRNYSFLLGKRSCLLEIIDAMKRIDDRDSQRNYLDSKFDDLHEEVLKANLELLKE